MIELSETIRVERDPGEAFDYLADFTSTTEWDATAQNARKLTPGPPAEGTRFLINCALPLGSLDLDYEIIEADRPHRLVLRGQCRFFTVTDTITFRKELDGLCIGYRAQFEFSAPLDRLEPRLEAGFQRMGAASAEGLRCALADNFPSPGTTPAALSLPSRLKRFTRYGYRKAKAGWNPVSAGLRGRHAVVTGASSGLGEATAFDLARRGAALTLVVRDRLKGEQLRAAIDAETGNRHIRIEVADLSLLGDVDSLCQRLRRKGSPVHILVNNAGALFPEHALTTEGIERSTALLLLSPYRLTTGLLPLLRDAGDARVINVVSGGMYTQKLSLAALRGEVEYAGAKAYAQAKRALMVVTGEWAEQWCECNIAVNAMHPGWVDTPGLERGLPGFHRLTRCVLRSPRQGADTITWLAAASEAGDLSGGLFLDRQPQPLYLRKDTREGPAERAALMHWLENFSPGVSLNQASTEESYA